MHAHEAWASAQPSPAERSQPAGKRRPRPFTAAFIVLLGTILATALAQRWLYAVLDLMHSSQCSAAQPDAADVSDKAVPFTTGDSALHCSCTFIVPCIRRWHESCSVDVYGVRLRGWERRPLLQLRRGI